MYIFLLSMFSLSIFGFWICTYDICFCFFYLLLVGACERALRLLVSLEREKRRAPLMVPIVLRAALRYLLILCCLFCFDSWRTLYPSHPILSSRGLYRFGAWLPGSFLHLLYLCLIVPFTLYPTVPFAPIFLHLYPLPSTQSSIVYRPSIHSVVDLSIHPHSTRTPRMDSTHTLK
ncbi:hypothetical protein DFP72DRAFT_73959 [Ephemerocybe angulata]|uniref:Uncharacterized protein n=1 Tax=Ephemerocybe angulata TaxID=980116 RepID=A0A8H6I7S4_9AGAR|nr:hypothetical protein DFP72DRAFT_73959 [Tulosesus angulatus]